MRFKNKCGFFILAFILLIAGVGHSSETPSESTDAPAPAATEETTQHAPNPSGFIEKMEYNLQKAIREERIATLAELNKERRATLFYMTHERLAATEDLRSELNRLTATLISERQAILAEMEVIGDRLVGQALDRSKSLIDHFFVRLLQLLVFAGVPGVGVLLFFKRSYQKENTENSQ